ncbi:MAG: ATP-dependent Clp protease adaptor ClpS [Bacteroidia bacterium]|nr:ATP-dependent Clp protease adaptor ClpS [Bacteroidia bacterium]
MKELIWNNILIKEAELVKENIDTDKPSVLVVWNDNVNTFEWVIQSLVEICEHKHDQAEQCAWIIHTKGKYAVKHGPKKKINHMRQALVDRGIGATVEEKV